MTNPIWSGPSIAITAMTTTITAGHILSNFHIFKSHLHKEPRQALFCFLSLKRFTLNSSFFSWLLSIYELLEKSYCIITHSKPIDKSYKHYFNPNI